MAASIRACCGWIEYPYETLAPYFDGTRPNYLVKQHQRAVPLSKRVINHLRNGEFLHLDLHKLLVCSLHWHLVLQRKTQEQALQVTQYADRQGVAIRLVEHLHEDGRVTNQSTIALQARQVEHVNRAATIAQQDITRARKWRLGATIHLK
jgi:hypothetical protein